MAEKEKPTSFDSNSLIFAYSSMLHVIVGFTGWFIPQILRLEGWKEFATKFFLLESCDIVIQGTKSELRFKFSWNFEEKQLTVTRVNERDEGPLDFYPDEMPNPEMDAGARLVDPKRVIYDFTRDIAEWKKRNTCKRPT